MEDIEIKPLLSTAVFTFLQEPNTNGTTGTSNEDEELTITMESGCGGLDEEGGFYVLRTNGWSIDEKENLLDLFKQIQNIKYKNEK